MLFSLVHQQSLSLSPDSKQNLSLALWREERALLVKREREGEDKPHSSTDYFIRFSKFIVVRILFVRALFPAPDFLSPWLQLIFVLILAIMIDISPIGKQIHHVANFQDLVSTTFSGQINAICWNRKLTGDFSEIVKKIELNGNIVTIEPEELIELQLSEQGKLAREILLNDWKLLKAHGASPILNVIKYYDRDDSYPFFPTDVYSFHVDRSPIPTDTFLCTYFGESSEIVPNSHAQQKVLIPEIRDELKKLYHGPALLADKADEGFESFLSEHFFDLHYQAESDATPISLGLGHLWRLAVDHPRSQVPPCVHRAPEEKSGQNRLLMIC